MHDLQRTLVRQTIASIILALFLTAAAAFLATQAHRPLLEATYTTTTATGNQTFQSITTVTWTELTAWQIKAGPSARMLGQLTTVAGMPGPVVSTVLTLGLTAVALLAGRTWLLLAAAWQTKAMFVSWAGFAAVVRGMAVDNQLWSYQIPGWIAQAETLIPPLAVVGIAVAFVSLRAQTATRRELAGDPALTKAQHWIDRMRAAIPVLVRLPTAFRTSDR